MRRLLLCAVLTCVSAGRGGASFECLPGPAAGGLADRAWEAERMRAGVHGSFSLGRPAAVEGLSWVHLSAVAGSRRIAFSAHLYSLRLEDVYRETSGALWIESRPIGLGIRRWQVDWGGESSLAGWTWEGEVRRRRGPLEVRLAGQGLPLVGKTLAGPERRLSLAARLRAGAGLAMSTSAVRRAERSMLILRLDWTPITRFVVSESFRYPGSTAESALEIGTGRFSLGLWVEPAGAVGLRSGARCSIW